MTVDKRQFIRHPSAIPLVVHRIEASAFDHSRMRDVSLGGLVFEFPWSLSSGMMIRVAIPSVSSEVLHGMVVWALRSAGRYIVGMAFASEQDALRSRIVEQVCQIETYRRTQLAQGRELSGEQAAVEWIGCHAAGFPLQDVQAASPAA